MAGWKESADTNRFYFKVFYEIYREAKKAGYPFPGYLPPVMLPVKPNLSFLSLASHGNSLLSFFFNPFTLAPLLCCRRFVYSVNAILHTPIRRPPCDCGGNSLRGQEGWVRSSLFTDCVITFKTINDIAHKFSFQPCKPGGHKGLRRLQGE